MDFKKKLMALILIASMLLTNMSAIMPKHAEAASTTKDHGFTIDENLFDITWSENNRVKVYQTCYTDDTKFYKGAYLGYANISVGVATTCKAVDGKIYQRVLVDASMVPQTVVGTKKECHNISLYR